MSAEAVGTRISPRPGSLGRSFVALVSLGRPIFLLGGCALYGLGAAAAVWRGHAFDFRAFFFGQLAVTAIQLMTHYANDYFDYEADRANRTPTRWSGGSRVLVDHRLPRIVALRAAQVLASVAVVAMASLVTFGAERGQLGALALFMTMQLLAWSYSGPPLRLHSRGFGEPTVALVVPLLTPLSGYVVQAGRIDWFPVLLVLPLCFLQLVMLITIEFPDHAGDRAVGKRSWVVLFGAQRAARITECFVVAAFVCAFLGPLVGVPERVAFGWLVLVPLAALQMHRLRRGHFSRPTAWESLAFGSVALFFLAIVVELVALTSGAPSDLLR